MARGEGEGEEFERVNGCTVSYVDVNYGFIYLSIYPPQYIRLLHTYAPGTTPIAVYTPPRLTSYCLSNWFLGYGIRPQGFEISIQ